ncbi:MAG: Gfo/Idh/MocA family oxidoreductase [Lentisphaeria bacterium]
MREIKAAVVGLGWVSGAHIETLKQTKGVRLSAVCSQRNPSSAEVETQYGLPLKVYADYQQVLADPDIDMVSLCTRNPLHAEQAIAAIKAGKHVYIEKPIALNLEDCRRIRDEAQRHPKVCICVGFECRFSQQVTLLRQVLDKGLIGEIHYAEVDYYHGIGPWYGQFPWSCRKDGGGSALLSGGCHALDALLLLMGDTRVTEVSSYETKSKAACFQDYEYNPCSVSILKFADGKLGKVTASIDCLQPYYFHFQLLGSKGSILDNKFYSTELSGLNPNKWSQLETILLDSGDVVDHPYQPQFQHFIAAIQNQQPMPLTGIEEAYRSHLLCYAAEKSAIAGRTIQIAELEA